MPTVASLVTETVKILHGYGQTSDRQAVLSNAIGTSDLSFTVDAAQGAAVGINPGPVEIDSEMLFVTAVDSTTNTCVVANGFGRGYDTTTATSHVQYSKITSQPKFPRVWVLNQMNEVLSAISPALFAVRTYTTTVTYPTNTYTPGGTAAPLGILDCQWQDVYGDWVHTPAYSIDQYDGTFRVGSGPMLGRPIRFIYKTEAQLLVAETDDFVSATGLPASAADLLVLGVAAKMVPTFDISRAQMNSVEQQSRSQVVPPNTGINIGTYLQHQFDNRLKSEADSLRRRYPPRLRRIV